MGELKGFIKHKRILPAVEQPKDRLEHFKEFYIDLGPDHKKEQAARCMDCGIPFCHNGCPLGNLIPDFNDAVYQEEWEQAYHILKSTNNFPEFTGRICPAPCEASCVLSINSDAVAIEFIEKSIIEKAFEEGWVSTEAPEHNGKKVAIVGSGPAGLACADELNQSGVEVTVYEKSDRVGGLLRYGIPDFKLEKNIVERRIRVMEKQGVHFKVNTCVGEAISAKALLEDNDALVICGGAEHPRDLPIEGRSLKGIHFAMDFLSQCNKTVAGDTILRDEHFIDVKGENIVVIGGGDTGSDCIGNSNRFGAKSIVQIELLGKPPTSRTEDNPWPLWPMVLKTSSSHEEGCDREWALMTKRFLTEDGIHVSGIETVAVEWTKNETGKHSFQEIAGSNKVHPCDHVFLAMGFTNPIKEGLLESMDLELDDRGNVKTDGFKTNASKVFCAGDMRRGQSLVVWAIAEGRDCGREVLEFLDV